MPTSITVPKSELVIVSDTAPQNPIVNKTLWWNSTEQMQWFWNGTYWLSNQIVSLVGIRGFSASATGGNSTNPVANGLFILSQYNLFVEKAIFAGFVNGINDASNYWTLTWGARRRSDRNTIIISEVRTNNYLSEFASSTTPVELRPNQIIERNIYYSLWSNFVEVGAAGNIEQFSSQLIFRYARP